MPLPGNAFVQRAYDRLAGVYDLFFGIILQPGRRRALLGIPLTPGLRVLELGIGTGLTAPYYRPDWHVTGIDLSLGMLQEARKRLHGLGGGSTVRLIQADGARLPFDDETFDIVLAPYVMSVVPDPIGVGREIRRVCRPDGRVIILNHFLGRSAWRQWLESRLSPLTERIGFRTDLPLAWLLAGSGLEPVASQAVNVPPIWTLVTCVRAPVPGTGEADRLQSPARP